MACTLPKCQGQETQKRINLSTSKQTKDSWQLNAACDPGLDLCIGRTYFVVRVLGTIDEIWMKSVG